VWSLGSLIGPVAGGIVVDILGFSLASFIIVLAFLITAFFFALFHLFSKDKQKKKRLVQNCELGDQMTL